MCVHVFCANQMPNGTLVWADRQPSHIYVYADQSLASASGSLTPEGVDKVNEALSSLPGAPTLEAAKSCQ